MDRPKELESYNDIELKLGIKSSLQDVKSTLALAILFAEVTDLKPDIAYSESVGDKIVIEEKLINQLLLKLNDIFRLHKISEADFIKEVNSNPLFTVQLEPLIVAFELIWKYARITFIDLKAANAERQGKKRYKKQLHLTINADILHNVMIENINSYYLVLLKWLGISVDIDEKYERRLISTLSLFSQEAIYKTYDGSHGILFNQNGIYKKLINGEGAVNLKSDDEAKGSLRILNSFLKQSLDPFINYDKWIATVDNSKKSDLINYQKRIETYLKLSSKKIDNSKRSGYSNKTSDYTKIEMSHNKILYGAPGTGKSYKLREDSRLFGSNLRRVTFHPNILYSDFIGSYKPVPTKDSQSSITYSFVPGALLKTLTEAFINPSEPHLLIIEELNRANVSATFGEMFQLLDRDSSGCSEYPIDISEDLQMFFEHKIFNNEEISDELKNAIQNKIKDGLVFPENLYIWATMNSADQGVLPLDTAFKRRWDFEYFSVDNSYDEEIFDTFGLIKTGENEYIKWNDIRTFINDMLSNLNVPEDKLMGPYFLAKNILESDNDTVTNAFKNKVLMYLFEDIGSQYRNKIFNVSKQRLSTIRDEFDQHGLLIFKNSELLKNKTE
ncbi:AAA family ATPase [Mammaliicoccus sciuri]|uniref:AAA family ATPase n=1 Tax=Mammaliicoccus sciuri TaxID=1296 RepID=UPI003F5626EA